MAKESAASGGVGVTGLLGVVFVTLKLLDKIDWQWRWVLAPFWMPLVLAITVMVFALGMWIITGQYKRKRRF